MKLELEVYELGKKLICLQDNKVSDFYPVSIHIDVFYSEGYSHSHSTFIRYKGPDDTFKNHKELFKTREELVEHLIKGE